MASFLWMAFKAEFPGVLGIRYFLEEGMPKNCLVVALFMYLYIYVYIYIC